MYAYVFVVDDAYPIPASSLDLTRTGGRYFTCDLDERTLRRVLVSCDTSCGVCECSTGFRRSRLLISFHSERAKDLMPPGQESLVIIVDYKTTTLRTNPSISVARKVSERTTLELVNHVHSLTGSDHPPTTLRRDARKSHRCESPPALEFLLQGNFPFLGSCYP